MNQPQPPPARARNQKQPDADAAEEDPIGAATKVKNPPNEVMFGQVDSLLIAGDNAKVIEKILVRLSGGSIATIGEDPAFEANQQKMFRDSIGYAWVNVTPFVDIAIKNASSQRTALR